MAATITVACHICGDVDIPTTAIRLIAEGDGVDYSFTHCDVETRRHASVLQAATLIALDVKVEGRPLPKPRCSCGLTRFHIGGGVLACRNCDAPLPGLPPADRSCGR